MFGKRRLVPSKPFALTVLQMISEADTVLVLPSSLLVSLPISNTSLGSGASLKLHRFGLVVFFEAKSGSSEQNLDQR